MFLQPPAGVRVLDESTKMGTREGEEKVCRVRNRARLFELVAEDERGVAAGSGASLRTTEVGPGSAVFFYSRWPHRSPDPPGPDERARLVLFVSFGGEEGSEGGPLWRRRALEEAELLG